MDFKSKIQQGFFFRNTFRALKPFVFGNLQAAETGAVSSDWESGSGTTEGAEPVSGTSRGPPRSNAGGATAAAAAGSAATPAAGGLERQGSVIHRERMIAHSTALESITMDVVDHNPGASSSVVAANAVSTAPLGGGGVVGASVEMPPSTAHHNNHSRGSATVTKDFHHGLDQLDPLGTNNVWGGIPAKSHRGENLLLFIGMIDILQSYGMFKKVGSAIRI